METWTAGGRGSDGGAARGPAAELDLGSLLEEASIGVFRSTIEGRLLVVNGATARLLGYASPAEVIAAVSDVARQHYVASERRAGYLARVLATRDFVRVENAYRRRDGSVLEAELHVRAVRDARGEPRYLEGFIEDITERKRADEALRLSEQRYRMLFELESDAIILLEESTGQIVEVNEAATRLYGYPREEFVRLRNVDVSVEPEATRERTLERASWVPHRRHRRKDGSVFTCEIYACPFAWGGRALQLVAIRDITERLQAEEARARLYEQLQRAQKMEAVGRLAGGIAHDFNNLLFVVRCCAELVRERFPAESEARRDMEEICGAAQRGAELTRQLLAFSRQEVLPGGRAEAAPVLRKVAALLQRLLGSRVRVQLTLPDQLGVVPLAEVQLEQVLLNLAINARDAMPEGGTLELRAELRGAAPGEDAERAGPGRLLIAVRDTGTGMSEAVRARLFEPFFTTKPVGVGTGLGLSTSHAIVREAGGTLTVESAPGAGSTFTIDLPLVSEHEGRGPPRRPPCRVEGRDRSG